MSTVTSKDIHLGQVLKSQDKFPDYYSVYRKAESLSIDFESIKLFSKLDANDIRLIFSIISRAAVIRDSIKKRFGHDVSLSTIIGEDNDKTSLIERNSYLRHLGYQKYLEIQNQEADNGAK